MGKVLPILGIVAAFLGACVAAVLVDAAVFLVLPVTLAGSVVLLGQRTILGAVAGLVVLALTVLAALGIAGAISTEDGGSTDFGIAVETGLVLAIAACVAVPVAGIAVRWEDAEPRWLAVVGAACAVLAVGIAAASSDTLTDHGAVTTLAVAALALVPIAPLVMLLRLPGEPRDDEPAPLAVTDAPLGKRPASEAHKAPTRSPGRRP